MSEIPSPPVERVLRHLEVAQVPSVKELPQFPLFLHNAKDLRKLITHNNEVKKKDAPIEKRWDSYVRGKWGGIIASPNFDGNIADAEKQHMAQMELEKESFFIVQEQSYLRNTEEAFLLHDVNTNISLLSGLEMFKGAENKPTPSWYPEYKRLHKEITTFSSHPEYSVKDKLERYNALARHIRRHANEIELPDGQSEYAKDYLANAVNMAHLWPMLHASGNMVDAIYKQNFGQIDKWYKALVTMRIPMERLARAFGNDMLRNENISFPQGDVDGLQGMTLFNIIQEIRRTRLQSCKIEKNGSQFSLNVKAGEVPQRDRLFKPSEVVNGKTLPGDGAYTVHQFHSVLAGNGIQYNEQPDAKPLKEYSFTIFPTLDSPQAESLLQGVNIEELRENIHRLQDAMTEAKRIGAFEGWKRLVDKAKNDVAYANFEIDQAAKRGECEPFEVIPKLPPRPMPPYDTSGSWQKFVMHDINGVLTLPQIVASALGATSHESAESKILARSSELLSKGYNISRPLPNRIQAADAFMDDMATNFEAAIAKEGDKVSQFKEYFEKSKRSIWIWKMISSSAHLLEGIHTQNAAEIKRWATELSNTRVMIADIVHITDKHVKKIVCTPPELLSSMTDGVRGIMLFNLLKNAHVHAKSEIQITENNGELVVANDTKEPVDSSVLFQPMKKGQDGNTGFGLFTLKHVYGAISGVQIEPEVSPASVAFHVR